MSTDDVHISLKQLFVNHFNINGTQFNWDLPLEELDEDFKTLSYLMFLEQLLNSEFKIKLLVLERINTSVHTPKDIVNLVEKELKLN